MVQSATTMIRMNSIEGNLFVNMDEIAVYFDTHHNYTINEKGAKTVSVRHGCSNNKRCTVWITVAANGTKLPLFVIFKGASNGPIANSLQDIMPAGMYGCTQAKGWMDNRVIQLWKEIEWRPYIEGTNKSALLLYQMESHIHPSFIDAVDSLGTQMIQIPNSFTSVSQPYDVGIVKPFKTRLVELCQEWKVAEYKRIGGTCTWPYTSAAVAGQDPARVSIQHHLEFVQK